MVARFGTLGCAKRCRTARIKKKVVSPNKTSTNSKRDHKTVRTRKSSTIAAKGMGYSGKKGLARSFDGLCLDRSRMTVIRLLPRSNVMKKVVRFLAVSFSVIAISGLCSLTLMFSDAEGGRATFEPLAGQSI